MNYHRVNVLPSPHHNHGIQLDAETLDEPGGARNDLFVGYRLERGEAGEQKPVRFRLLGKTGPRSP